MPAYSRGDLSVEGYLLRILAALCRQSGGELRISGEEVDRVGEPTTLTKEWDSAKQQIVLRVESVSFREVFRLTPEKQTPKQPVEQPARFVDPLLEKAFAPPPMTRRPNGETLEDFLPKSSTLDDARLSELERRRKIAKAAALIRDELRRRKQERTEP